MPINRDLSHLPKDDVREATEGMPPDRHPRFAAAIAEKWYSTYESGAPDRAIPGTRYRGSNALARCFRQLYYEMSDTPKSEPATLAESWRMNLGQMVHVAIAPVIRAAFPDATFEVVVDLRPQIDGSARADIVIEREVDPNIETQYWVDETGRPVYRIFVEVKTVNGYKFKMKATTFNGPPQGPDPGHITQSAVAAHAAHAQELVILYLSLEVVAEDVAVAHGMDDSGRFMAEWTFKSGDIRRFAEAEAARVAECIPYVEAGVPPLRMISDGEVPPDAVVSNPNGKNNKGVWVVRNEQGGVVKSSTTWRCGYCWFKSKCIEDGEGGGG